MTKKNYSPIKTIFIKNFRNIGEAQLDFSDSPIISLIGDNEAGKTSVVKAFAVCALHAEPRSQKDFIRDGTKGFGVAIELEDGTIVRRMKSTGSNSYTIIRPDGTSWELGKTESVIPQEVQNVMGLKEEPETKEFLHIRTYEDRLLFVSTPASVNYKVMYDALKIDDITTAIKNGNSEANKLKQEISSAEGGIDTLTESLRAIRVYDMTHLLNIKARLVKEKEQLTKLIQLASLSSKINEQKAQLGALSDLLSHGDLEVNEREATHIDSIQRIKASITNSTAQLGAMSELLSGRAQEIDESQLTKIISAQRTLNAIANSNERIKKISELDSAEEINIDQFLRIQSLASRKSVLESSKIKAGTMLELNEANEVDVTELDHLIKAVSLIGQIAYKEQESSKCDVSGASLVEQSDFDIVMKANTIIAYRDKINTQNYEKTQYDNYCKQMTDYLRAIGAAVEICPSCGEQVVIDIDKFKEETSVESEVV